MFSVFLSRKITQKPNYSKFSIESFIEEAKSTLKSEFNFEPEESKVNYYSEANWFGLFRA